MSSSPPEISVEDGLVAGEVLAALVHEGQLHRLSQLDRPGIGLLLAGDHLEEGRLPGAVRSDDADDGAGRDDEGQVVDEQPLAEALGDALELDHLLPQPLGDGDEDLLGLVAPLVLDAGELLEARQARLALGLARLGVLAHPLQLQLHGLDAGALLLGLELQPRPPSARASSSSSPSTGCRARGRAPGSTRPRCRGSSGRGSPPRRCPGSGPGTAPATPPTRRRGGWWARRAGACRAWRAGACRAPPGASRRRRGARPAPPRAAGAGRRRRSPGPCRCRRPRGRWWPRAAPAPRPASPCPRRAPRRPRRPPPAASAPRPRRPGPTPPPRGRSSPGRAAAPGAASRCGGPTGARSRRRTRRPPPP